MVAVFGYFKQDENMTYYVALDIGCLECGEQSAVLGIFTDEAMAAQTIAEHEKRQTDSWKGEHAFVVEKIENLNAVYTVVYTDQNNI